MSFVCCQNTWRTTTLGVRSGLRQRRCPGPSRVRALNCGTGIQKCHAYISSCGTEVGSVLQTVWGFPPNWWASTQLRWTRQIEVAIVAAAAALASAGAARLLLSAHVRGLDSHGGRGSANCCRCNGCC
eukprot:349830-Chlamydomonas_euryale.AAC.2